MFKLLKCGCLISNTGEETIKNLPCSKEHPPCNDYTEDDMEAALMEAGDATFS